MSNVTKQFVLAGRSIFTIEIPEDYRAKHDLKPHYTFRVDHKAPEGKWKETWFVKYLTGSDNTRDYSYLGLLNVDNGQVCTTAKSKLNDNNLVVKLLNRTLALIWAGDVNPMTEKGFGLHHEGRCGKCGRVLTTPTSISLGIGPECWSNLNGGHYPHLSVKGKFEAQALPEEKQAEDADVAERETVQVSGQPEETGLDSQTVTNDTVVTNDGITTQPVGISSETTQVTQVGLFDGTSLENKERLATLAEVMGITLEEALTERDLRLDQQADTQARKQRQLATA